MSSDLDTHLLVPVTGTTTPTPFVWKATAADIIEKVQRGRAALTRQINSTTDH